MAVIETERPRFIRKEREHLAVLQKRLEHLKGDHPERSGDPAYPAGEIYALAWALAVLEGEVEPLSLKVERLDHTMRKLNSRLGRVEALLQEEADER